MSVHVCMCVFMCKCVCVGGGDSLFRALTWVRLAYPEGEWRNAQPWGDGEPEVMLTAICFKKH